MGDRRTSESRDTGRNLAGRPKNFETGRRGVNAGSILNDVPLF